MFERLSFLRRLQITFAVAAVVFVIVFGALALRTALGKDPALGASGAAIVQSSSSSGSTSSSDASGTTSGSFETDDSSSDDLGTDDGSGWDASAQSQSVTPDSSAAAQAPMTTSQS